MIFLRGEGVYTKAMIGGGGGGTRYIKKVGMLVENFEIDP